jgi:hypothetical protein
MRKKNLRGGGFDALNPAIAFIVVFFLLLFFWQQNYVFSEYGVKAHNRKICTKLFESSYGGVVEKIGMVSSKSKRRVVFLTGQNWIVPSGQYHNLHFIHPGDSIYKDSNSFDIVLIPQNKPDTAIILKPNKVIFDCLK